ncbi:MAG TPA: hypothetical protein DDY71_13950 [Spirochaetia bacterium]|nr:hypothetical protein [Spirochaetia bacterium]HBI38741.1 hypothetical protein [Spirochaetia bacterium]
MNPYTDFGFKKIFGEEGCKELLKDFLNELLPEKYTIFELTLNNNEQLPDHINDRKAIFDIFCTSQNGDKFIVKMQKAKINYFKDRTIYYTTFPIRNMADKGGWDFNLKPVFCIAILDFEFHSVNRKKTDHISYVELKDQYCQRFYDKLNYIFIEMPKFKKTESELTTHFDKWLYFLKHLEDFDTIPEILNEPVFMDALSKAEKANYNEKQMMEYERSLMNYWDATAMIKTAFDDGRAEGKIEDKKETLCRQMSRKFQMNSGDIEIINKCEDVTNLDDALDEFVFADSKEVVLDKLG